MKARSGILAVIVGALACVPLSAAENEGLFRDPGQNRLTAFQRGIGRQHQDAVVRSRPVRLER